MDRRLTEAIRRGDHVRTIAAQFQLTEDSIRWRVKQLGLSLRTGWYSRQEIATLLGVSRRSVDRWVRAGRLPLVPHGTRWTRVTDGELRAFVGRYAGVLFEPFAVADPALRRLAETSALVNRRRSEAAS